MSAWLVDPCCRGRRDGLRLPGCPSVGQAWSVTPPARDCGGGEGIWGRTKSTASRAQEPGHLAPFCLHGGETTRSKKSLGRFHSVSIDMGLDCVS